MAQLTNTFETYDAVGNREDLQNIIYNITPTDTPFMSSIGTGTATFTKHEWQTDSLASAASNAQIEGDDSPSAAMSATSRVLNYTQISYKPVMVSGTQEAVIHAGVNSELAYQIAKKAKELKRDMEATVTGNQAEVTGNASTARKLGSLGAWVATNDDLSSAGSPASGGAGNSDNSSIFSKYNLTLGCNQPTNIADRFVEFVNGSNRMGGFGTAGLTFGTDTADANALSDYEEGSWTPAYTPASGSFTMFNASGTYVKIGKLVMCSGTLSCNGSSSPSGAVHISGLPFTVDAVGGSWNNQGGGGSVFPGYNFTNDMTNLVCVKSGTTAYVFDDSATGLATSDVGTGYNEGQSSFTFTYTHA